MRIQGCQRANRGAPPYLKESACNGQKATATRQRKRRERLSLYCYFLFFPNLRSLCVCFGDDESVYFQGEEEAGAAAGDRREVSWGAAEAVGAVCGGDTRPFHQGEALAWHVRHGGGSSLGLRQSRPLNAGLSSSHQLRLLRHAAGLGRHLHHLPRRVSSRLLFPFRPAHHSTQPQSNHLLLPQWLPPVPITGTVRHGNQLLGLLQSLPGTASGQQHERRRRRQQSILQCDRPPAVPLPGLRPAAEPRFRNGAADMGQLNDPRGVLGAEDDSRRVRLGGGRVLLGIRLHPVRAQPTFRPDATSFRHPSGRFWSGFLLLLLLLKPCVPYVLSSAFRIFPPFLGGLQPFMDIVNSIPLGFGWVVCVFPTKYTSSTTSTCFSVSKAWTPFTKKWQKIQKSWHLPTFSWRHVHAMQHNKLCSMQQS